MSTARVREVETEPPGSSPGYVYQQVCPVLDVSLPELCVIWARSDPTRFVAGLETLRTRFGYTPEQLAAAAGVAKEDLASIPTGVTDARLGDALIRLSESTGIGLGDLAYVILLSPNQRRFHIFNAGIGKSGTTSIARIFSRHAAAHEFAFKASVQNALAYDEGVIDDAAFAAFLRARDRVGQLEVDSAGFHAAHVEHLVQLFPAARFILTIREPYAWLEAFFDTILEDVPGWEDWHFDGIYGRNLGLRRDMLSGADRLLGEVPRILDTVVRWWADPNRRVLEAVPAEKLLIVHTHEISTSLERLARFAGVDPSSLDAQASRAHTRRAAARHRLLRRMDPTMVEACIHQHAADLIQTHFPDSSLDRYLSR